MKQMRKSPDEEKSVRCSQSGCSCSSFRPGGVQLRSCDHCGHGWVAHALQELQAPPPSSSSQVEVALPGLVLDLSSLVLYGTQAVPVRLKILLDRLYSVLTPEQVGRILETVGWTLGDYVRGYVLQTGGRVLDRWSSVTWEEEPLVLEQFLRFGETRPIVELMALSDPELRPRPRRGVNRPSREGSGPGEPRPAEGAARRPDNRPGGLPLLLPFHFSSSAFHRVTPPTKVLGAPSRLRSVLQTPGDDEATDLKIKTDPDGLNRSLWDQSPPVDLDQQDSTSFRLAPPPPSSSLYTPSSSSPSILRPLPSFSSSFLCPVPASPLCPPPPELCSVPLLPPSSSSSSSSSSSTGGRKGRVCCGVCGKSFYDKGTLKIHYNAVHLKIKHGCTVAGCAMVFSSLRSRNRHSANPNPRLHTPPREGGPRGGACSVATGGLVLQRDDRGSPSRDRAPPPPRTPNCPRPSPPQTWNCPRPSTLSSPTLPLFIPAVDKRPLHRATVAMATGNHVRHRAACGGTPKPKRRKSSTPVKIDREALMEEEEEEEERGRS